MKWKSFSMTASGQVTAHVGGNATGNNVTDQIARQLPRLGAQNIEVTGESVRFRNEYPIAGPRLLYGGVDRGDFTVDIQQNQATIYYEFSIRTILVFVSSLAGIFLLVLLFAGATRRPVVFLYPLGLWISFYAGNYILTRIRTHSFLYRCLRACSDRDIAPPTLALTSACASARLRRQTPGTRA